MPTHFGTNDASPELSPARPRPTVYARHVILPGPGDSPGKSSDVPGPAAGENPETPQQGITESMTLGELYEYLRAKLGDLVDEYFSRSYTYDVEMAKTPRGKQDVEKRGFGPIHDHTPLGSLRYRWLCVYPVTGGSEGHYVHVDLQWQREYTEGRVPLYLGKTFGGMEQAMEISAILIRELERAGML